MFYRDKRVLVTGGTGFVGMHIVQELMKKGARVRVSVHKRPMVFKDKKIETIAADLTKEKDCRNALRGIDYCFHAAGAVSAAAASDFASMEAITTNLILTARVLKAAWEAGARRLLLFGSSTAYPAKDHPVKEDEMWAGPTHPAYFGYGWMRRYIERLGEFAAQKSGLKIALIRPTAIYGRFDNFDTKTGHVIPSLIRKAVERMDPYEVWGTGDEMRDLLHVADLARASLLMMERHALCDPVNIGYGKTVAIKEVVPVILNAAGYKNARVVFNSSKPTTIPLRTVDTSKAAEILGFRPRISLEKGIADTVRWYSGFIKERRRRPA